VNHLRYYRNSSPRQNKNQRRGLGFTLVEVIIAVVVISILATISVVAYNGVQHRAREAAIQADTRALISELEAYYGQYGSFPMSTNTLNNGQGVKVGPNHTFIYAPISSTGSTASGYCVAVYNTVFPKNSVFAASHKKGEIKGFAPTTGTQVCTAQENSTTVTLTITGTNPTAVGAS
jgi:prepilin-type N-terminal cleavage/methylation domain-containing protein